MGCSSYNLYCRDPECTACFVNQIVETLEKTPINRRQRALELLENNDD